MLKTALEKKDFEFEVEEEMEEQTAAIKDRATLPDPIESATVVMEQGIAIFGSGTNLVVPLTEGASD
ncbi:hypothetical protein F0562_003005 [Nyssa sinensis]|uniref:Uncharacterized protein n=1 Tax=Nyssa sinensis TaxID=561372 RepID=A0A5J5BU83_9ASTE|nr:hypothetical protein F0562_003005 [Nyssa sinensis]